MSENLRTVKTLTRAGARAAMDAALAHGEKLGKKFHIAIVDHAGHLMAYERMDGAQLISQTISQDKAWSVIAGNGLPTAGWLNELEADPALKLGFPHRPNLVVFGGGVPVLLDGDLVGAIGVSGGSAEEDAEVAQAGADAVA